MDRDEALKLLRGGPEGVAEWNRWRTTLEFRNNKNLPILDSAMLADSNLDEALLIGVSLRNAVFDRASLHKTYFGHCNLSDATFLKSSLKSTDFKRAKLNRATFEHSTFDKVNFEWSSIVESSFRWTKHHKTVFRHANLTASNFEWASLAWSNFDGSNLTESDMHRSVLHFASIDKSSFSNVNFEGSTLYRSHFLDANLVGAVLDRTVLAETRFERAIIHRASFAKAKCRSTIFADIDLSDAQGLDSVVHEGPSTVGLDTLIRSRGIIPEVFLRGCGVPDSVIAYIPALIGSIEPIQFYSCFISYSTKDEEFARRLHSRMRDEGLRVWFAPEDIQAGRKIHEQIDDAIRIYDKLLLVLSEHSMNSEWVKTEIRNARQAEVQEGRRKLFPIRLVDFDTIKKWKCFDVDIGKDIGVEIREYFIPDFTNWKDHDSFEAGFARLLRDLKAEGPAAR